jgi:hypothetical protein
MEAQIVTTPVSNEQNEGYRGTQILTEDHTEDPMEDHMEAHTEEAHTEEAHTEEAQGESIETPKRNRISKSQIESLYEFYLSDYLQAELVKLSNLKQSSKAQIVSNLFEEQYHITVSIPTIISLFKSDISLYEAGNKKYYIKTPKQKLVDTEK